MNKINDNLYTFEGQQDIVSPQLVYYPAIIRENIRKMIDIAGGAARLWPHIKTHKMAEVVQMQIEAGIDRFKCATIAEAEMAAKAGAKTVVVRWEDDKLTRLNMELADEKDLTAMKPYELRSYLDYAEDPDGCCTLAIHAEDPEALAGLDAGKLNRVNLARRTFMKPWQEYTMNDRVQWCVAAVPAPGWAAKVFPELPLDEAVEKLWALIFDVCRVSTGDPVGAWQKHVAVTKARRDRMNALELDRIHMTSSNGTDLTVGLADDATWEGASSKTEDGIEFIANVPTEEVFCAPHRERTNGIVYGTKPYAYNGQLIEGWHVTFKDGVVVEHGAEKNADLLAELLSTDENSNRIGEIALVPASSPINRSGVLFYNTLFDENASCHLAFGEAYPECVEGGEAMSTEERKAAGLNDSNTHVDFMIGTSDLSIIGTTKDGREVPVFVNGNFAL